jgi:hypothetical protein
VVLAAMWPLVGFPVPSPLTALAFAVLGSLLLALLGVLAGCGPRNSTRWRR